MSFQEKYMLRVRKIFYLLSSLRGLYTFLRFRVVPSIEHRAVLSGDLSTVVDVGANRGQFALAARLYTDAMVYSFEPLIEAVSVLESLFSGDRSVKIFPYGICESKGERIINISKSDDSSSFLEIGKNQIENFPGTEASSTASVKTAPITNFLSPKDIISPAILKIDVQGYELVVLRSAEPILMKFDYVYCECSFVELYLGQPLCSEVIEFLAEFGFKLSGVFNTVYGSGGQAIQADFYFVREPIEQVR